MQVCCNLCVWSDGLRSEVKVRTLHELAGEVFQMLTDFQAMDQIRWMKRLTEQSLTESQFAKMIGRLRMYQYLPSNTKANIPELQLTDSQISSVVRGFYQDENFQKGGSGDIGLWQLFNLFTEASKTSYIDRYLARNSNASSFISVLQDGLKCPSGSFWLA